jgi:hypothetical protein
MATTTITTNNGKIDYADPAIACYLSYPCAYCLNDFLLVDPDNNFAAGGAIQRQVLERDKKTGEITKIGKIRGVCISCAKAMIQYERKTTFIK